MRSNAYPINREMIVSRYQSESVKPVVLKKAKENYERSIKFIDFQSIYTFIKSITP